MDLIEIIQRQKTPLAWAEGEKIPWNDPGFSGRMLREHLSQAHDAASRRFETIDSHVAWIHQTILSGKLSRILDLGCGPGLYCSRFARLGHECYGIDFSPASIRYASECAAVDQLRCAYLQEDIRSADYGSGYDLAMLVFGEFNVFRRSDARLILRKSQQALAPGGKLLLEAHTYEAVQSIGDQPPSWYSSESGLFSDCPHLCLMEDFWDARQAVATERYFIVDGLSGKVTRYASSMQAYTDEDYRSILQECGFEKVSFFPSLWGEMDESQKSLKVITAQRASLD